MATLNRLETLRRVAGKLAEEELANHKNSELVSKHFPKYKESSHISEDKLWSLVRNDYLDWLKQTYDGDDSWDEATEKGFDSIDLNKLRELRVSNRPARAVKQQIEFNAFLPLFEPTTYVNENGEEMQDLDWYGRDRDQMEQFAKTLGYNIRNQKERSSFYDKVREHATAYEKAKAVSDYQKENSGAVLANAILTPTAYKEQMKQALTDEPYDERKVNALAAIDGAVLGAMLEGGVRLPYLGGVGATAGAESVRQAASGISGNGVDIPAVLNATVAQATVPQFFKGLGRFGGQSTDQGTKGVVKEFMAGVRGQTEDALQKEKDGIVNALLRARNEAKNRPARNAQAPGTDRTYGDLADGGVVAPTVSGEDARISAIVDKLRTLKFGDDADEAARVHMLLNTPGGRQYTVGQMIDQPELGRSPITSEEAVDALRRSLNNGATFTVYRPTQSRNEFGRLSDDIKNRILWKEVNDWIGGGEAQRNAAASLPSDLLQYAEQNADKMSSNFARDFPTHWQFHTGNYTPLNTSSKAYRAGMQAGPVVGSLEAGSGISLQQGIQSLYDLLSGEKSNGISEQKKKTYTEQDWYKELNKTRQGKALLEQLEKRLKGE